MEARPGVGGPSAARGVDRPSVRGCFVFGPGERATEGRAPALPGLSGGSFSPEAPYELEMSTTSSEAYIDGRVERDLIVLAGGAPGQPARARMSRLASPPSRESHDGAMRTKLAPLGPSAGSPPRRDARATRRPRGRGASRLGPPMAPVESIGLNESLLTPDVDARRKLPPERRARRREAHERTHRTRAGSVRRRAKPSRREKHRPSPRQRSPRGQRRAPSVWIHAPPRPPLPRVPRSRPSLHGLKTQPVPKFGTSNVSAQRVEAPYLDSMFTRAPLGASPGG